MEYYLPKLWSGFNSFRLETEQLCKAIALSDSAGSGDVDKTCDL